MNDESMFEYENPSGVVMQQTYRIRVKSERNKRWRASLIQLFLVMATVLSTIDCFVTAIDIEVDHKILILSGIGFCTLFWGLIQLETISLWIIPNVMFVFVLYADEHLESILQGVYHLENYAVAKLNDYFGWNLYYYVVENEDGKDSVTLVGVLVIFVLAWVYTYCIYTAKFRTAYVCIALSGIVIPGIVGKLAHPLVLFAHCILIFGAIGVYSVGRAGFGNRMFHLDRRGRSVGIAVGSICMIILGGTIAGLNWIVRDEIYKEIPLVQLKSDLQSKITEITSQNGGLDFFPSFSKISTGGLTGGDLSDGTGEIVYTHNSQLKVTMQEPAQGFYLKGFTGAVYSKSQWSEATDDKSEYSSLLDAIKRKEFIVDTYTILNLEFALEHQKSLEIAVMPADITIDYVNANQEYLYYPYYTWYLMGNELAEEYSYDKIGSKEEFLYPLQQRSSYHLHYYDITIPLGAIDSIQEYYKNTDLNAAIYQAFDEMAGSGVSHYLDYKQYEQEYRDYVKQTYLQVNKEEVPQLAEDCAYYKSLLNQMASEGSLLDSILFVRNYLYNAADYTLVPGPTPEGEDFVEYFIYQSHKGYCAHYASAATLMLRLLGIPARYVEGYYVSQDEITDANVIKSASDQSSMLSYYNGLTYEVSSPLVEITVDDSCAHAWVEVYIDGFGWYPVEFTEPASEEDNETDISALIDETLTPEIEPTTTPIEEKEESEPSQLEPENDWDTNDTDSNNDHVTRNAEYEESQELPKEIDHTGIVKGIVSICLIIVFVLLIGYIVRRYRCRKWRLYFKQKSYHQRYIRCYQLMERLRDKNNLEQELSKQLEKEEWEFNEKFYYGVRYEECRRLREDYLRAVYSGKHFTKEEFETAMKHLEQMYAVILRNQKWWVRLWCNYIVYLPFSLKNV